jgi:hypothetical protein
VLDREGLHLKADNPGAREEIRLLVVLDDEAEMVGDVRRANGRARELLAAHEPSRYTRSYMMTRLPSDCSEIMRGAAGRLSKIMCTR